LIEKSTCCGQIESVDHISTSSTLAGCKAHTVALLLWIDIQDLAQIPVGWHNERENLIRKEHWCEVLEGDDTSLEGRGLIFIYIVNHWIQNVCYAYIFNGATQYSGEVL
jgi:hypothetical protein